jgi:prophage regulatory protein
MRNELSSLVGQARELQGRASAISSRMSQDALLLVEVERELSLALARLSNVNLEHPGPTSRLQARVGSRILRPVEVAQRLGLSRTTIWRMVRAKDFPAPHGLSGEAVGWLDVDVDAWLASRRDDGDGRHDGRRRHWT